MRLTAFLICMTLVQLIFAQSKFLHPNVCQTTRFIDGIGGNESRYTQTINGDTIINGLTFQRLCSHEPGAPDCNQTYYGDYVSDSAGVILIKVNNPLGSNTRYYDFNLNVGDTFFSKALPYYTSRKALVDSTDYVQLNNGDVRERINLHIINSGLVMRWVYGIGDIDRGLVYSFGRHGDPTQFMCQQENGIVVLKHPGINDACSSCPKTTSTTSIKKESVTRAYPNPNKGEFTAQDLDADSKVEIINTQGKKIDFTREKNVINLRHPIPGMYFLEIDGKAIKFIVE